MYAVIDIKGHQYIVEKWSHVKVDLVSEDEDFSKVPVLMLFDAEWDDVRLGMPYVDGAYLSFAIHEPLVKDEKVNVIKFRRKNRYTRTLWFRAKKTILHVTDLVVNGK